MYPRILLQYFLTSCPFCSSNLSAFFHTSETSNTTKTRTKVVFLLCIKKKNETYGGASMTNKDRHVNKPTNKPFQVIFVRVHQRNVRCRATVGWTHHLHHYITTSLYHYKRGREKKQRHGCVGQFEINQS